jgi:hypothetical protein
MRLGTSRTVSGKLACIGFPPFFLSVHTLGGIGLGWEVSTVALLGTAHLTTTQAGGINQSGG